MARRCRRWFKGCLVFTAVSPRHHIFLILRIGMITCIVVLVLVQIVCKHGEAVRHRRRHPHRVMRSRRSRWESGGSGIDRRLRPRSRRIRSRVRLGGSQVIRCPIRGQMVLVQAVVAVVCAWGICEILFGIRCGWGAIRGATEWSGCLSRHSRRHR